MSAPLWIALVPVVAVAAIAGTRLQAWAYRKTLRLVVGKRGER